MPSWAAFLSSRERIIEKVRLITPEEPAAARLADGDDGRMRELPVGRDGVEALAKLLGATDHAHAVVPAHLRLDRARGREYAGDAGRRGGTAPTAGRATNY